MEKQFVLLAYSPVFFFFSVFALGQTGIRSRLLLLTPSPPTMLRYSFTIVKQRRIKHTPFALGWLGHCLLAS